MAVFKHNNIIRVTADDDIVDFGTKVKVKIAGVRLVSAAADCTASIRVNSSTGDILMNLTALAKTSDECSIPFFCDSGKLHVDLAGTGAEVYIILE
jgi:hypothetical protein